MTYSKSPLFPLREVVGTSHLAAFLVAAFLIAVWGLTGHYLNSATHGVDHNHRPDHRHIPVGGNILTGDPSRQRVESVAPQVIEFGFRPRVAGRNTQRRQSSGTKDPILQAISDFIDEHAEFVESVRRDLKRILRKSTVLITS